LDRIETICSPLCSVCGIPFNTEEGIDHRCGACLSHHPAYTAARAAFVFTGPAQELIHRFKYGHKTHLDKPLALLTARSLENFIGKIEADLVIPVPLHKKRLRWRGYNQAVLLASVLAKKWEIPLTRDGMSRIRWTEPQINLSGDERRHNIKGAFAITKPGLITGKRVMLVDDVITTGSTVVECAKTLKKGGAAEVFVIAVARTVQSI